MKKWFLLNQIDLYFPHLSFGILSKKARKKHTVSQVSKYLMEFSIPRFT